MKKIIIALIVVLMACSCVTETGMCFDMRVTESTYRIYEPTVEPFIEEPVETPPMVGAMVVIRTDEEGSHIESNSSDSITTSASTEADVLTLPSRFPSSTIEGDKGEDVIIVKEELSTAPYLPPTTLEEETYSGRTGFLSRADGDGVELDIHMTNRDNPLSADFNEPIDLSLDVSGWNEPESFRPMWTDEDGRGSTLIVDPNFYVELGDDWDNSDWSDEPSRPTDPGTYRVYGW